MGIINENKIQNETGDPEESFDIKNFIDQICNFEFGTLYNATMPLLNQIQKLEASSDTYNILSNPDPRIRKYGGDVKAIFKMVKDALEKFYEIMYDKNEENKIKIEKEFEEKIQTESKKKMINLLEGFVEGVKDSNTQELQFMLNHAKNQMKSDKTSPKRKREYESENENNEKKFCNWEANKVENNDKREIIEKIKIEKVKILNTQSLVKEIKEFLNKEKISRLFFSTYVLKISRQYFIEIIDHPIKWENLSIKGREPYINMNKFISDKNQIKNCLVKYKTEQKNLETQKNSSKDMLQVSGNELVNSAQSEPQINRVLAENILTSVDSGKNDSTTNNSTSTQNTPINEKTKEIESSSENQNQLNESNNIQNFEIEKKTKTVINVNNDEDDKIIVINDSDSEDDRSVIEVGSYYRNEMYFNITEDNEECINIKFEIGDL